MRMLAILYLGELKQGFVGDKHNTMILVTASVAHLFYLVIETSPTIYNMLKSVWVQVEENIKMVIIHQFVIVVIQNMGAN